LLPSEVGGGRCLGEYVTRGVARISGQGGPAKNPGGVKKFSGPQHFRHEDSDNIDNFQTGLNMKLYNQGFPFLYNTFYQGVSKFCQGGGGWPCMLLGMGEDFGHLA
jgi:hypothetical protein